MSCAAGFAGAVTVTLLHQLLKHSVDDAPRLDSLGRQALVRGAVKTGIEPPRGENLQAAALAGDLVANTTYYSAVALAPRGGELAAGLMLGAAAGVCSLMLPGPMGLDERATNRSGQTQALTVALYTLGGLMAGAVMQDRGKGKSRAKLARLGV